MLEFKNVKFSYSDGTRIFDDLSFKIDDGEFVYLIGPTGVGKTTLTRLITSEIIPTSGDIFFYDTNIGKLKKRKIPEYRKNLGVIYQEFYLLEYKTCIENITYVLEMTGLRKNECIKKAREVLRMVDLSDKSNKFPHELSGGGKQRLAIARAIVNNPKMLICDEPTANLDPDMANEVVNILEKINKETNTAIIFITHNSTLVNERRKRTIVLDGGVVNADLKDGGYYSHNSFIETKTNQLGENEETLLDNLEKGIIGINDLNEKQKDIVLRNMLNKTIKKSDYD